MKRKSTRKPAIYQMDHTAIDLEMVNKDGESEQILGRPWVTVITGKNSHEIKQVEIIIPNSEENFQK
jgi:hypothetical protein